MKLTRRCHRARRSAILTVLLALTSQLIACSQASTLEEHRETVQSLTEVAEQSESSAAVKHKQTEHYPEAIIEPRVCSPYLVITARGTGEPKNGQLLSPVARAIKASDPERIDTLTLDYPADTNVNEGGTLGVHLLLDTLRVQAAACPEQRFALLGYSQGALVIGDALARPELRLIGVAAGVLDESTSARILAVVFYGNPRFSGKASFAVGNYDETLDGILPRNIRALNRFAGRMVDFCVAQDFICQSGIRVNESGHTAYFSNGMQQQGVDFVIEQLTDLLK